MSIFSTYAPRHAKPVSKRLRVLGFIAAVALCAPIAFDVPNADGADNVVAGVIATALAQQGTPYQYGAPAWSVQSATGTKCATTHKCTFDCSSLVQYSFERHGITVPRTTGLQWNAGKKVPLNKVVPGDIVFFSDNNKTVAGISHVGLLIGHGLMVEAPHAGATVRVVTWKDRPNVMPYAVRFA
jgi:cell wall-associated NlpC family hydrolase